MAICKELKAFGASQCGFPIKVARRLVFVPLVNESGAPNMVPLADVTKLATWQPAFDGIDTLGNPIAPQSMFYVLPNMENVEDVRADTEFFEWNSGSKIKVRQGVRTYTGVIPNETPNLLGQIESWEGTAFGVYVIDTAGNLIFRYVEVETVNGIDQYAAPIPVDGNSLDAKYMLPTYSDPLHIVVQFDYAQDYADSDLYMIPQSQLDFDGRTSDFHGLTTVYGFDGSRYGETLGWFTDDYLVHLSMDYSVSASGFTQADFQMSSAAGTITGVTETNFPAPNEELSYYTITTTGGATGDTIMLVSKGYTIWQSAPKP